MATPLPAVSAVSTPPLAGGWELCLLALRRRTRFRVQGRSMAPTLAPEDEVLLDPRAYRRRAPAAGDIVVCLHPYQRGVRIVKRVARVSGGRCTLAGDQPADSTDSRSFGTVALDRILGRVTARL